MYRSLPCQKFYGLTLHLRVFQFLDLLKSFLLLLLQLRAGRGLVIHPVHADVEQPVQAILLDVPQLPLSVALWP